MKPVQTQIQGLAALAEKLWQKCFDLEERIKRLEKERAP